MKTFKPVERKSKEFEKAMEEVCSVGQKNGLLVVAVAPYKKDSIERFKNAQYFCKHLMPFDSIRELGIIKHSIIGKLWGVFIVDSTMIYDRGENK